MLLQSSHTWFCLKLSGNGDNRPCTRSPTLRNWRLQAKDKSLHQVSFLISVEEREAQAEMGGSNTPDCLRPPQQGDGQRLPGPACPSRGLPSGGTQLGSASAWLHPPQNVDTLSLLSRVPLSVTPGPAAHQAPPSMGFSRQEHWSGLPISSTRGSSQPRDPAGISCIAGRFFTTEPPGKPSQYGTCVLQVFSIHELT